MRSRQVGQGALPAAGRLASGLRKSGLSGRRSRPIAWDKLPHGFHHAREHGRNRRRSLAARAPNRTARPRAALELARGVYGDKLSDRRARLRARPGARAQRRAAPGLDVDTLAQAFSSPSALSSGRAEKLTESFGGDGGRARVRDRRAQPAESRHPRRGPGPGCGAPGRSAAQMLLAMVADLASCCCACEPHPERAPCAGWRELRRRTHALARETLDIYAPLAKTASACGSSNGNWRIFSFRYLEPELYKRIAGHARRTRRSERERFIEQAIAELADSSPAPGTGPRSPAAEASLQHLQQDAGEVADFSEIHDASGLGACWSRRSRTATPARRRPQPCGRRSRANSTLHLAAEANSTAPHTR